MRRARQRKKLVASNQVYSDPSYEAFTISTPRGLSAIGTPVDASLTGRKRPASDAEQSHDSASFGTLVQHVVVERGDVKDGASACQQHSLIGGVGSARSSQQASSTGVKQIVLRLSGLRQSLATSGEPPSGQYGEPAMKMGTEVEPQREIDHVEPCHRMHRIQTE